MFKDILLPLDVADRTESVRLFAKAAELVKLTGARLHVVHVVPDIAMPLISSFMPEDFEQKALQASERELKSFTKDHVAECPVAQHIIGHGTVYKEIVRIAEETACDLILMGPGDEYDGDFLVGHNSARVMRHAGCSVLLLK